MLKKYCIHLDFVINILLKRIFYGIMKYYNEKLKKMKKNKVSYKEIMII